MESALLLGAVLRPAKQEISFFRSISPLSCRNKNTEFRDQFLNFFLVSPLACWNRNDEVIEMPRIAEIHRVTAETTIDLRLDMDGSGRSELETGVGFLDHMLTHIARHGIVDLSVRCK